MANNSWLRDDGCIDSCTCQQDNPNHKYPCKKYSKTETFYTDTQGKWDTITSCNRCGFLLNKESK